MPMPITSPTTRAVVEVRPICRRSSLSVRMTIPRPRERARRNPTAAGADSTEMFSSRGVGRSGPRSLAGGIEIGGGSTGGRKARPGMAKKPLIERCSRPKRNQANKIAKTPTPPTGRAVITAGKPGPPASQPTVKSRRREHTGENQERKGRYADFEGQAEESGPTLADGGGEQAGRLRGKRRQMAVNPAGSLRSGALPKRRATRCGRGRRGKTSAARPARARSMPSCMSSTRLPLASGAERISSQGKAMPEPVSKQGRPSRASPRGRTTFFSANRNADELRRVPPSPRRLP